MANRGCKLLTTIRVIIVESLNLVKKCFLTRLLNSIIKVS
jgi:hypothetical protein